MDEVPGAVPCKDIVSIFKEKKVSIGKKSSDGAGDTEIDIV